MTKIVLRTSLKFGIFAGENGLNKEINKVFNKIYVFSDKDLALISE